jgi:hypothetical protein
VRCFQDAFADSTPLRRTVTKYFDQAMVDAIAAEDAKGRILLVGTTNLDARRPIIWNITKVAASRSPRALELIHDILIASAAIPGAFPPVMIDVEVDGKTYQEMHVDGGASAQVYVYPPSLSKRTAPFSEEHRERQRRLYVIRNARLDPEWSRVERATFSILQRAVTCSSIPKGWAISIGSTSPLNVTTSISISPTSRETLTVQRNGPFNTAYMRQLFAIGHEHAVKGYQWAKVPPGFLAPHIEPPLDVLPTAERGLGPGRAAPATGP